MTDVNANSEAATKGVEAATNSVEAASDRARGAFEPTPRRRWLTLALVCTAFFVVVSDSTIVYAALPSIGEGLSFSEPRLQWVVIAYLLTSGALLLLGGRVADLFGRRRTFVWGVVLFSGMSLLSGLAWSSAVLVAARTAQGIGAAIMVPAALSILVVTFADGDERNKALGLWGALAGIGATGGLLLGGPITELFGWRWVFLVNVPIGALVLALAPALIPGDSAMRGHRRRLDLPGGVTITLGLFALVYAVVAAPRDGWGGSRVLVLLASAVLLVVLFVGIERRTADPLVPLRLFRSRSLVGGNLLILAAGMSVDGLLFTVTMLTQQVWGYSATRFGLVMAVMTATSFVGVAAGQHLVSRFGVRSVATCGFLLIGAGSTVLVQVPDGGSAGTLLLGLALFGPGMGAAFVAGQIAALAGVSDEDAGLASGVEETTFAIGGAVGVAVLSSVALSGADLVAGSRSAFVTAAAVAALGVVVALALVDRGVGMREAAQIRT
jgi:EmrB/QacA subfamily drug resistance transporter